MATSQIREVYNQLAQQTIKDDNGKAYKAKDLDELPNKVEEADLPIRLLLPFNARSGGQNYTFLNYGHTDAEIDWLITDLLLLRSGGLGRGPIDEAENTILYARAYAEFLTTWGVVSGKPLWVANAQFTPGIWTWPTGTANQFYGVEVQLTIREAGIE
jgi:hypothetical protein